MHTGPLKHLPAMASLLHLAVVLLFLTGVNYAQLSGGFYSQSCPGVFAAVRSVVQAAISKEARMGASLVRLFFHDCFVNGCDGSLLLDDITGSFTGEKNARANVNSTRGFEVVDDIKSQVEEVCPGVVSCADILAIAARDSVVILGGPDWDVKLGRRDARTAGQLPLKDIPSPTSSLSDLISSFQSKGLSAKDMVALSGSHTIGKARCITFKERIYNDTNIDPSFAKKRQSECPSGRSTQGDNNLADLDVQTPATFDNCYFKNLLGQRGLLHSDQELFNGGSTDSLVRRYSSSSGAFSADFAAAMTKMGDIGPLTGSRGEIRKNCRVVN